MYSTDIQEHATQSECKQEILSCDVDFLADLIEVNAHECGTGPPRTWPADDHWSQMSQEGKKLWMNMSQEDKLVLLGNSPNIGGFFRGNPPNTGGFSRGPRGPPRDRRVVNLHEILAIDCAIRVRINCTDT